MTLNSFECINVILKLTDSHRNTWNWKDKCEKYVEFMIERLYELEDDKGLFVQAP